MPESSVSDPRRLDIRAIVEVLRGGRADGAFLRGFLPATYQAPEQFRGALHAHAARRPVGLESRPGEGYDIYCDCLVVHLGKSRRAFVSTAGAADAEVSHESLHLRAGALAAAWKRAGVEALQSIAVVMPVGVDYLVALLAALRLGAVISAVAPVGGAFVRDQLARLGPDHTTVTEEHRYMLGDDAGAMLPLSWSSIEEAPTSHVYGPADPVLRILSPFGETAAEAIEVSAAALHEGLLRDGLVIFGLDETDTLAAPGFDAAQFQPHLVLATLAAGAAYAELAPEDVLADPRLLDRLGVTVLGVRRDLRDILLQSGGSTVPRAARAWFRSLTDVLDVDRWDALARSLWARKIPGFGVVASVAAGGVHLFSPPSSPAIVPRCWPAPGRSWRLTELAAGGLPALNAVGTYTPLLDDEPDFAGLPRLILVREADGFVMAGAIELGRDAQSYPTSLVARVVESEPAVRYASVVVAAANTANDAKIVVIAFVEDERGPNGENTLPIGEHAIAALIEREMGKALVPDRIEIFPLRPRLNADGAPDGAWCRRQYLGGTLHAKARSELFVLMSRLGYILAAPRGDA
jgi:hypothetical protein